MPLVRYQIRDEYGLADPELYKGADKDDPEALLEGVAMAGLVGVLRQLGDLSEFAADVFHGLHEEVMSTAARGHGLIARVQQLEAEACSIEKAFLSQTDQSPFFTNTGVEWHPNLRAEENLIACGDLPRFVRDSYEECRGPPQLFLLDKFDVAGAGACLKRYTDPSLFKVEAASSGRESWREKKMRKVKKKGSRWRNGETPEIMPTSHAKLHQLFLEERVGNSHYDPARLVKLKRRQINGSMFDLKSGKSYMEKFLGTPSPEDKAVCEASVNQSPLRLTLDNSSESGLEILEIKTISPTRKSRNGMESMDSSPTTEKSVMKSFTDDSDEEVVTREIVKVADPISDGKDGISLYNIHKTGNEDKWAVDGGRKTEKSLEGGHSDDLVSEVDNYVDALATMESEMETDNDYRLEDGNGYLKVGEHRTDSETNREHLDAPSNFSDPYSFGNSVVSDDGKSSPKKGRSSFSYSDSLSDVSEHSPSDSEGAVEAFPNKNCASEVLDAALDKSSVQEMQPGELVVHNNMRSKEDTIPSTGEASCSSHLSDSNSLLPPSVSVGNTVVVSSQETVLDESHSKSLNLGSDSLKANQNAADLPDSFIILSNSSQEYHSHSAVEFSEGFPAEEVYHEDPDVSVCISNTSYLEKEGGDSSASEMLQTEYADGIKEKIESPDLGISLPREQLFSLVLQEVAMDTGVTQLSESLDVVKPVEMDSEIKDVSGETRVEVENLTSLVEPAEVDSTKEKKCSDIAVDVSQDANDLIEAASKVDVEGKDSEDENNYSDKFGFSDHVNLDEDVVTSPVADATLSENHCPHSKEMDFDEVVTSECCVALEKQKEAEQGDDAFTDENSSSYKLVSDGQSNMDVFENVHKSDPFDQTLHRNSSDVTHITTVLSSVNNHEWGTKDAHLRNCIDSNEHIFNFPICNTSELETAFEQQSPAFKADQILGERTLEVMDEVNSESFDLQQSPPCHIADPGIPLERSLQLQSDQATTEYLQACETSPKSSNIQSELIERSDMGQERCLDSSAKQEVLPGLGLPTQSAGQEINGTVISKNPFESAFPSFGPLPENLEEMPPLPPLPPMQWRLGKSLPAGLAPQGEWPFHGQDTLLPTQSFTADEEFQADSVSFTRGNVQPSNSFLCVASDIQRSECSPANSVESSVQPSWFSTEMPTVATEASIHQGDLSFEEIQKLNPFLNIPETKSEGLEDDFLASRGNPVGSSSDHRTSLATVEPTESEVDPGPSDSLQSRYLSEGTPQSISEAKAPENRSQNAEGEERISLHKSILPPAALEDQPSLDVVTSHVKNSLQDAEGEERNSSDESKLPPSVLEDRLQHDVATSSVNTTCSQTTSALPPTYEIGKLNGSKLPRPRNPLIDAVAAHGIGKLRKVTERVHPQIGQKADERDSLLEQIRNKSFNLKPTAVTRPSIQGIQGPKTNLKVAALLEKANAIRQALTGSDEDDDSDSWSDS